MSILNEKRFHNEKAAYAYVEAHVWPNGPVCPHCGGIERIGKLEGKSTRIGAYKCYQCRKPFTVKIGTIFEDSHVKLHIWLQAIFLMVSSKKGISTNQLHRTLGVTLKTAWFMTHRIREAMRDGSLKGPMGGNGQVVEIDETYFGRIPGHKKAKAGYAHKNAVLTLVQRGGKARSFHVSNASMYNVLPIVNANIAKETAVMTDESTIYKYLGNDFASHETVKHKNDEYVRGNVYTNTAECFFSVFKRGMKGTYQHCSEKHLHRYLAEFDFRYNNRKALGVDDATRAEIALRGIIGKRLTYQTARN